MAEVSDFRYLGVPHTHWDREWYLPFEAFRLRLGAVVDGVLDTLERDRSFTSFTLDGQAIVLEDYVEVRPENEDRLRALLKAGRLEVGPSYVLPDEILVGGESLVRNLLLGRRVCRRFGVEPSGDAFNSIRLRPDNRPLATNFSGGYSPANAAASVASAGGAPPTWPPCRGASAYAMTPRTARTPV